MLASRKDKAISTFGINKACTRSEAIMFLRRLAGKPESVGAIISPFKDVPKTHDH